MSRSIISQFHTHCVVKKPCGVDFTRSLIGDIYPPTGDFRETYSDLPEILKGKNGETYG